MIKVAAKRVLRGTMWIGRATIFGVGLAVTLTLTLGVATAALATVPGDPFKLGEINTVNAVSTLVGNVSGPTLSVENDESNRFATALNLRMGNPNLAPMQTNATGRVVNFNADAIDGREASSFADGTDGKADNADELDGKDSSDFATGTGGKADNADNLDGKDSAQFLATNGKASDADRLDGKDGSAFVSDIYLMQSSKQGNGGGSGEVRQAFCDLGDRVLGGGGGSTANPVQDYKDVVIKSQVQIEGPNDESWFVQARDNGAPSLITAQAICADFTPEH
jgi:hypothetical protein